MKFNLANLSEFEKAFHYLTDLGGKECIVDIKKVSPNRSLSQNAYLHLLLGAFGEHFGYTVFESKEIYKELNKDIYSYTKKGRKFMRSSADLTKEDMAKTIDLFMLKSAEQGYPLPLASDEGWLREIENKIEQSRRYL